MNELMTFNNSEFGKVRSMLIDNEPWFVGKDVAEALGYAKTRNAIDRHVDDEDKKDAPFQGVLGGKQIMVIINESGLYSLILSSKLPTAKAFKRWVTSEILPSIRKTGSYSNDKINETSLLMLSQMEETCNSMLNNFQSMLDSMYRTFVNQIKTGLYVNSSEMLTANERDNKGVSKMVKAIKTFYKFDTEKEVFSNIYRRMKDDNGINLNALKAARRFDGSTYEFIKCSDELYDVFMEVLTDWYDEVKGYIKSKPIEVEVVDVDKSGMTIQENEIDDYAKDTRLYKFSYDKMVELLNLNGIAMSKFKRDFGISSNTLRYWKNKINAPRKDRFALMCDYLNVTPAQLMD